jgi:hypothetical protein
MPYIGTALKCSYCKKTRPDDYLELLGSIEIFAGKIVSVTLGKQP